jgi:predicted AAA+ superfamily ATPase
MFARTLEPKILSSSLQYRIVALIGPRQSGKTTLAKKAFPDHTYFSLENPDLRLRAVDDPRRFLDGLPPLSILDEIQHVPELFSYLQEIVDDKSDPRRFILTGSNSFQLNEKISQSLAGRIRIFSILPLSLCELPQSIKSKPVEELLVSGGYPRIYDEGLNPSEWFESYYQTYLQKDVKEIINVSDTNQFDRFVRLCAGRISTLTDYNSVASEVGVSQPTAVRWSSVLESSFITFRLSPHFKNFGKRLIKSPKLYFYDTGLVCQLLRIRTADQLENHPLRGAIFENFVISECMKNSFNQGIQPAIYFWRDKHGHEIDLMIDRGHDLFPIEIKSGSTFNADWLKNLEWFDQLQPTTKSALVYNGKVKFEHYKTVCHPWQNIHELLDSL